MGRDTGGFAGELTDAAQQLRPWAQVHLAEINEPILPIDELGIVGAPPTWKLATDEAIPTLSMMVGRGPTKPRDVKVTDDGELLVAPTVLGLNYVSGWTEFTGSPVNPVPLITPATSMNSIYAFHVSVTCSVVSTSGILFVGVGYQNNTGYVQLHQYVVTGSNIHFEDTFTPISPVEVSLLKTSTKSISIMVQPTNMAPGDHVTVAADLYYT